MKNKKKSNKVLIGMPGCGKSTIGKLLSEKLEIEFYDVDAYIEKQQEQKIVDIFKNGESFFRKIEKEAIKVVSQKTPSVISTGGGVIKDKENIDVLKETGIIIFINRPLELIFKDITTDDRPLLKDNIKALESLYNERYQLYKKYCDFEIINNSTIENILEQIIHLTKNFDSGR
ncbi:shikimate kinase [Clostridium sediminicola]|uniref:shikimate kinase n=1 Tax=Clostridium sediminicola TaxID=3114879 RepID=UPI0031F1E4A5